MGNEEAKAITPAQKSSRIRLNRLHSGVHLPWLQGGKAKEVKYTSKTRASTKAAVLELKFKKCHVRGQTMRGTKGCECNQWYCEVV